MIYSNEKVRCPIVESIALHAPPKIKDVFVEDDLYHLLQKPP